MIYMFMRMHARFESGHQRLVWHVQQLYHVVDRILAFCRGELEEAVTTQFNSHVRIPSSAALLVRVLMYLHSSSSCVIP